MYRVFEVKRNNGILLCWEERSLKKHLNTSMQACEEFMLNMLEYRNFKIIIIFTYHNPTLYETI